MFHQLKSLVNKLYNFVVFHSYRSKSAKEVFKIIYDKKKWSGESFSGPGSDLQQTEQVRKGLEQVIDNYSISSLLDIPCGDWYWMQRTDLTGLSYLGADIVEEIVEKNQAFIKENVDFQYLDLLESELPKHDLVFCRDCLVHFSFQDVQKALDNLIRSGSKYMLVTTFPGRKNYDIVTGNWRPINLEEHPIELPKPLMTINEGCTEGNGKYADKSLGLWDLVALKQAGTAWSKGS